MGIFQRINVVSQAEMWSKGEFGSFHTNYLNRNTNFLLSFMFLFSWLHIGIGIYAIHCLASKSLSNISCPGLQLTDHQCYAFPASLIICVKNLFFPFFISLSLPTILPVCTQIIKNICTEINSSFNYIFLEYGEMLSSMLCVCVCVLFLRRTLTNTRDCFIGKL